MLFSGLAADSVPFLYGLVGFLGAVSLFVFVPGFILYIVRLGQDNRTEGITIATWGLGFLFIAVCLIGVLLVVR